MALVIGVSKGSVVYLDDEPLEVVSTGKVAILVKVKEQEFSLTPYESTEVYPKVFVSVGVSNRRQGDLLPRLLFEAPRNIAINRKELYEHRKKIPPVA